MSLITIGTSVVDVADVALVAPRGSASQVYLADGSQLASALTAAAQATAVNATGSGTQLTTVVASDNFGACYISGPNTQRVDTVGSAHPDESGGTVWFLRGGPGPVVCSAVSLVNAQALIAATNTGVSGDANAWVPVVTDTAGIVTLTQPQLSYYTRTVGTVPVITAKWMVAYTATGAGDPIFSTVLPFAMATTTSGILSAVGPAAINLVPSFPDVNTARVTWVGADLAPTNAGVIIFDLMYRPAS